EISGVDRSRLIHKYRKHIRLETTAHQYFACGVVMLAPDDRARPGYYDRRLLGSYLFNRRAENILVIEIQRCNNRNDSINRVCRIEPPTQPDLEHRKLRTTFSKVAQRDRGYLFEKRRRR